MFDKYKINKETLIPAYHQIYSFIKEAIDNGSLDNGEILPSENDLCKRLNVSRITVRKAFETLEKEGYIKKEKGKNSTVIGNQSNKLLISMNKISTDLLQHGVKYKSEILKAEFVNPIEKVRKILNLKKNQQVFVIERLRYAEDHLMLYSVSYLVPWLNLDFKNIKIDGNTSLKELFNQSGEKMAYCDETVEAIVPNDWIKSVMKLDNETAVFYRERITYNEKMEPFEYVTNHYNGKYYKYFIEKGKLND